MVIAKMKRQENQGAAMIVAIVVSVILTAFTLSLLLLSYSLFASVNGKSLELQCRELAKSVDEELGQELMDAEYEDYDEQFAAAGNENNLWFFVRYNLWQGESWPYYNEDESGHDTAEAYRYFKLDTSSADEYGVMADQILITMYWEKSTDESEEDDKSSVVLHIRTDVERGDYAYSMDSAYVLTVTSYDTTIASGDTETLNNAVINPDNNEIDTNEKWTWTPD